jgi:hypothetical protein
LDEGAGRRQQGVRRDPPGQVGAVGRQRGEGEAAGQRGGVEAEQLVLDDAVQAGGGERGGGCRRGW